MKYQGVCIAVKDVKLSEKFYQDLFGLEVFQDYGINISFGGLSLQQDFDRLLDIPQEKCCANRTIWNCTLKKMILMNLSKN